MNPEHIRQKYDAYMRLRTEAAERLRAEINIRLDEELAEEIADIRQSMLDAHAEGHSLVDLRKAVRAYGNTRIWRFWWTGATGKPGRPAKGAADNE